MAKGTQTDGTVCRTDNCKRHGDAPLKAVLKDVLNTQMNTLENSATSIISKAPNMEPEVAERITKEFYAPLREGKTATAEELAAALMVKGGLSEGDAMASTYEVITSHMQKSVIRPGDQIIINATGERGTASEGDTSFNKMVRFNPENSSSPNSFKFFGAKDVSKLDPEANHNYVREQVLATPADEYIPASDVRVLMEQETNSLDPNARAAKQFGTEGQFAGEYIRNIGRGAQEKYGVQGGGLTRRRIVNVIKAELAKEIPNDEGVHGSDHIERVRAVKSGLRSILGYIDPMNANRLTDSTYLRQS